MKPFFLCQCCHFIFRCIFFLSNNTSKTLSNFLQVGFSSVHIIKISFVLSTISQFSSAFHLFFNEKKTSVETETKLDFISSLWDDDHIQRLDEITGNANGVIKISKESMLLKLLLKYWRRRVCILKFVMLIRIKLV